MKRAIALSGGGARGDFEVGVLRYLYNRGLYPQIICTTSVGSINGVKLAEGGDYLDEGIACYVNATQAPGTALLCRLLNPSIGDDFYPTSAAERDAVLYMALLARLENIWLGLQSEADMYQEEPWMRGLARKVKGLLE